jgi:hypothetical protein
LGKPKLLSVWYRRYLMELQRKSSLDLTDADKDAWATSASKHEGMLWAVQHLKTHLMQPTLHILQSPGLPIQQQLYQQAEQQAEQQALEALDNLQVTLGRVAGLKGSRLHAGKTVSGLGAVYSLWNRMTANEPRAASGPTYDGRQGKIELPRGAATPEVPGLNMKQMVTTAIEAGLCPDKPLSWWFGS